MKIIINEAIKFYDKNIIGNKIPYNEIPWFWTDQFGHNFQILGQIESFNKVITREYGDHKSISFFSIHGCNVF